MARPISGKERIKEVRMKKKNGDVYVYQRRVIYNPQKGYDDVLSSTLIGKYRKGSDVLITQTPRRDAKDKARTQAEEENITRQKIGLINILEFLGRESGIDKDLRASIPYDDEDTADKILTIARYWAGSGGKTLPYLKYWKGLHHLPQGGMSEEDCHALFRMIGLNPAISYRYFKARAKRLERPDCIAIDSTTFGTYSEQLEDARSGFNKDGDGLRTVKYLSLYAVENRQPLAFIRQPGNIPDVISVKNAIKNLDWLELNKPTVVMDNGFYSKRNITELMLNNLKFITRVEVRACRWVKDLVIANLPKLDDYDALCPFDLTTRGFTMPVQHKFETVCKYNTESHKAGEKISFTRRLYVHVFFNRDIERERQLAFDTRLKRLEQDIKDGGFSDLTFSEQHLAARAFKLRKTKQGLTLKVNNDYYHETRQLYGIFALISNNAKFDTFDALYAYRMRNTQETYFSKDKGMTDGKRMRVQASDTLDGRLFCQMVALGYLEMFYSKLRAIRAELKNIDPSLPADEKTLRRKLRSWLDNVSAGEIMEWFDCIELVKIAMPGTTPTKEIKITTETTARDELFLKMLGMKGINR